MTEEQQKAAEGEVMEAKGKDDLEAPDGAGPSARVWSCWSCTQAQTVCHHDQGHLALAETLCRFFNSQDPHRRADQLVPGRRGSCGGLRRAWTVGDPAPRADQL